MLVEQTIGGFVTQGQQGSLEKLIAFTLLDYEHQFLGRLNEMDSMSQAREHDVLLLFAYDIEVRLIFYSGMLNQLQN